MFIKDSVYLENEFGLPVKIGNKKRKKFPVFYVLLATTPFNEMLRIFDDALTHGFEIIIEDGKFYYLE